MCTLRFCFDILLKLGILGWLLLSFSSLVAQEKILFVTSNQYFYGSTDINAANHFKEIVVPYDVFQRAGYEVDFVSPLGGAIPIGYINTSDSVQQKYIYDGWFMDRLEHTLKPSEVDPMEYSAMLYSGGGAAMFGVPQDTAIQRIARLIYKDDGVISSICHGTAGLAFLKDEVGNSLYQGRKITGFPDEFEHRDREYYQSFPFAMNEAIEANGGQFVYSKDGQDAFYVVDGRFITGQDPSAASSIAAEVVELLDLRFKYDQKFLGKSELQEVREVLMDYIEGTAHGEPSRLRKAFHPDFKLYTVAQDTLWIRSGERYISNVKEGQKNSRKGKIISIDIENDAAIAKAEIEIPGWKIFTDFFLLLKYEGSWKIVQKSYTSRKVSM